MGDRANIVVQVDGGQIWLYTHWTGRELEDTLRSALARGRDRWDDQPYLTRIIFCEMVKLDGGDGLTGFGIALVEQDSNHPHIYVDIDKKTVKSDRFAAGKHTQTFEDFCQTVTA